LRVGAGVERQTQGSVLIDGREVAGKAHFVAPEDRGVGLMFQDYALFPHLSIVRNVMFGLTELTIRDARSEATRALARMGMESHLGSYPHALSGGEQQRVALARAIAPRPSVLLMDEPFSGLDMRLRNTVREETLAVLRETGATCVIVTHDPEEAMLLGDRIAMMRSGEIVQLGTPEELYYRPVNKFVAHFFSDINIISATCKEQSCQTPLGTFQTAGIGDGRRVDICIRPHGISIVSGAGAIAGRIVRHRFIGESDLLDIEIDGYGPLLHARVQHTGKLSLGATVHLDFDNRHVLVFAAEPA
jgi:iron(III) transport system ATP-binding protein